MADVQPRLGPSCISPTEFASQVFRSTPKNLASLPVQWRGVVLLKAKDGFTVDDALKRIASGEWIGHTEPHDVFLAYSGKMIA